MMKNTLDSPNFNYLATQDFKSLICYLSYPILIFQKDRIIFCNEAAKNCFNLPRKINVSLTLAQLFDIENSKNIIELNKLSKFLNRDIREGELNLDLFSTISDSTRVKCKLRPVNLMDGNYFMLEVGIKKWETPTSNETHTALNTSIFYASNIPMCIVSSQLTLEKFNNAFLELFDITPPALLDKFFLLNQLSADVKQEILDSFNYLNDPEEKQRYDLEAELITTKNMQIYTKIEVAKFGGNSEWLISIINQTREIELFKKLNRAEQKANQLKTIFVTQMSHEIRTPINAILSFANLIKDELKDKIGPELKTGFEVINRGGDRIIRTINLILDLSEVMTDSYDYIPKEFNIFTDVFSEVFMKYRKYAAEKTIPCNYSRETDVLNVFGDEYMIKQIILNILDNAVKFTTDGEITANLFLNENNKITLEISDSGIGMSEDYLEKIYEPFSQEDEGVNRKYEGNGLGLTLTKSYCEINDVDISIKSNKSVGTTIRLVFNKTISKSIDTCSNNLKVINYGQ